MARCAGQYGLLSSYSTSRLRNQVKMSEASLKDWAMQVGLTPEQIDNCWNSKDLLDKAEG